MAERRKPLNKKMRFEVFKRDKFTCQYCGRMSPDVILEVDHIKPVADGGTNDLLNLITSCRDCNRGKGKRRLDDCSEVKKQQARIKELSEKNEQLMMLMEWRKELSNFKNNEVDAICNAFSDATNNAVTVNENGRNTAKKLLEQFSLNEILDAVDIAINRYYDGSRSGAQQAWDKIGGICYYRKKDAEGDRSAYYYNYLRKSCKSRFAYCNVDVLKDLTTMYVRNDDDFDIAKSKLFKSYCWEDFKNALMEVFQ